MLSSHKKNILLLGGEGFIGRNIVDELGADYRCHSVGVAKSPFFQGDRNDAYISANPYAERIEGEFDIVIHLIDNAISLDEFERQERRLLGNIRFADNAQIILFSSAVLYANPTSEYAQRKAILESVISQHAKANDIKPVIFRLFNIFGKYQIPFKQGSFVANVLCNHLMHAPTEIFDMNAKRDFMFAADMAKFVRFAIEASYDGSTDLGTQQLLTLGEVISHIEESIYEKVAVIDKGMQETLVCPLASNALIENVGLTPMGQGLQETYDFYKRNIALINGK
ncbi:MAG: NAD(P)-dependent oxidoreductase [Candidatus Moranbacteria bacterium]|nr:NAD(P)-dependent oxidoreductase [Candidatus Moranbacteria bacterium]